MLDPLAVGALGLLLGLRHAFEPDHLAAVSILAAREGRLRDAVRLGTAWGAGHTASVGVVALAAIALGVRLPAAFQPAAELVVAAVLVLLGLPVILAYARGRWHMHRHAHAGRPEPHFHLHSHAHGTSHAHPHGIRTARRALVVGVVHGLAGSAALVVLLLAATPSAAARVVYFAAFGAGTIAGMLAVSWILSVAVRAAAHRGERWAGALHVGAALASLVAGLVLVTRVVSGP
jgi:ABC-type nickel/cobalt efflux system permease component RcnA